MPMLTCDSTTSDCFTTFWDGMPYEDFINFTGKKRNGVFTLEDLRCKRARVSDEFLEPKIVDPCNSYCYDFDGVRFDNELHSSQGLFTSLQLRRGSSRSFPNTEFHAPSACSKEEVLVVASKERSSLPEVVESLHSRTLELEQFLSVVDKSICDVLLSSSGMQLLPRVEKAVKELQQILQKLYHLRFSHLLEQGNLEDVTCTTKLVKTLLQKFRPQLQMLQFLFDDGRSSELRNAGVKQTVIPPQELLFPPLEECPDHSAGTAENTLDISCFACLHIEEQPGPMVVMKNQHLPFVFKVKVIGNSSTVKVSPTELMAVNVITEEQKPIRVEQGSSAVKRNQKDELEAVFTNLLFRDGSSQKLARLQFSLRVRLVFTHPASKYKLTKESTLLSELSAPLVVMVHQTQWMDSEKLLVLHEALDNSAGSQESDCTVRRMKCCSAALLCNVLRERQMTLCLAQNSLLSVKPEKKETSIPLTGEEAQQLVSQYQQNSTHEELYEEDIVAIWKSVGPYFSVVRDARRNFPLWRDGVIVGFMSEAQAERVLQNFGQPGLALIRFSSKMRGAFAISYISSSNLISHLELSESDARRKACMSVLKIDAVSSVLFVQRSVQSETRKFATMTKQDLQVKYISRSRRIVLE